MTDSSRATPPVNPPEATDSSERQPSQSWGVLILAASYTIHVAFACARVLWLRWDGLRNAHIIWLVVFVAVTTTGHLVGYLLWKRQPGSPLWKRQQAISATKADAPKNPTSVWTQPHSIGALEGFTIILFLLLVIFAMTFLTF